MADRRSKPRRLRGQVQVEVLDGRTLLSAGLVGGVWSITGTNRADVLTVDRSPDQPDLLRAFRNGRLIGTADAGQVREIRLDGRGGADTLRIDETHGAIDHRAVLLGGPGRNTLVGGSGPTVLDGGPGGQSLLRPGTGPTTLRQGIAADAVRPFGSGQAFRQFLSQAARRLGSGPGPVFRGPGGALVPVAAPVLDTARLEASTGHSQTNVQVAGVDEADIVETDGRSLFLLSRQELVIADVRQADAPVIASRTPLDGWPLAEYLDGDRLTVLTAVYPTSAPARLAAGAVPALVARSGGQVQASTYDVSDPTQPKLVLRTAVDGQYRDSRYVDGKLQLVLQSDLLAGYWGSPMALAAARTGNVASRLARAGDASVLPTVTSTAFGADGQKLDSRTGLLVRPAAIYRPVAGDDANLISVVVLDARGSTAGPVGSAAMLGSYASTLHVTKDTLDIFSPRWDQAGGDTTSIARFALNGGADPTLVATGTVPGSLINSYAADARGDDLRVATTTWRDGRPSSGLYVLRAQGDRLNTVGKVEGLAPGESLFAARFEADRAYLITFEQVDPLWAVDLTDATAPKVVGELKVPGFSRFLQPVADGYLLGIGRDVDPATQRTTDLQLSLFDVRDLSRPSLVGTYNIAPSGDGWTWSGAEWDPHAFGWFPELGVVAVPVQGGSFSAEGRYVPQSRLEVVRVDTAGGARALTSLGAVAHDSGVVRSVRIADAVYSIADLDLRSVRVRENGLDPLGRLVIQTAPPDDGPVVMF